MGDKSRSFLGRQNKWIHRKFEELREFILVGIDWS
jgi:hypothetical protein